jgi:hypothetical protein
LSEAERKRKHYMPDLSRSELDKLASKLVSKGYHAEARAPYLVTDAPEKTFFSGKEGAVPADVKKEKEKLKTGQLQYNKSDDLADDFQGKKAPPFDGPGGDPRDDTGRKKWDARDGILNDVGDVEKKHLLKIAKQTLKMNDPMARIMGGMSKEKAREVLKKYGVKNTYEAKKALAMEYFKRMAHEAVRQEVAQRRESSIRQVAESKSPAAKSARQILEVMTYITPQQKRQYLSLPINKMASLAKRILA